MLYYSSKTDKYFQYLLILFGFLYPLSVFAGNLLAVIILFLFFFLEDKRTKFFYLLHNKFFRAIAIFFLLHCFGMLWTDDLKRGLEIIRKMLEFAVLLPVLMMSMHKKNIDIYINSFIAASSLILLFSYLISFEIIPPFKTATIENPTPFMTHITHGPFIAFAAYISLNRIIDKFLSKDYISYIYIFLFLALSINVFITGGRAGQIVYIILLFTTLVQNFGLKIKILIIGMFLSLMIAISAYQHSGIFRDRADYVINELKAYEETGNFQSSIGTRLLFLENSLSIIKNNFLLGVGTGDFPQEYSRYNKINSPNGFESTNPHNMYLLQMAQFGIVGLLSLIAIYYYQIKCRIKDDKFLSNLGLGMMVYFLVINFSDSYLLGHFTSFQFTFFAAFLYQSEEH